MPKFLMGVEIMIDAESKENAIAVLNTVLDQGSELGLRIREGEVVITPPELQVLVRGFLLEYRTTHSPILLKPDSTMAAQMEILGSSTIHHPDTTGGARSAMPTNLAFIPNEEENPELDMGYERPGVFYVLGLADHTFVMFAEGYSCAQCRRPRSVHPTV